MSLGGGFGGLGGGESPLSGTEARRSQCEDVLSSIGSAGVKQIICLNLDGDGAGVGGGLSGGGGGGEEVAEAARSMSSISCRQLQSQVSKLLQLQSQFSKSLQHPQSSRGPFFGGILYNILRGAVWSVVRR